MGKLKILLLILVVFALGFVTRNIISYVVAQGGEDNLIHGCVRSFTGLLRIIGTGESCRSNETQLDWNKSGLPGTGVFVEDLTSKNFSGRDFSFLDFQGRDFSSSELDATNFIWANLIGTKFTDIPYSFIDFTQASLEDADFSRSTLAPNSTFSRANATGANFTDASLRGVSFAETNLTHANFTNTDLLGAPDLEIATRVDVIWTNTTCPDGTNSDNNGGTCEGHLVP